MVRTIAAISFVYDLTAGIALLAFPQVLPWWFGIPIATPAIYTTLNGLFLVAVACGYVLPYQDPDRYRGYMWIFGVALKTAGALAFALDYASGASPQSMLLFALGDAAVAGLTLAALTWSRTTRR